MAEMTELKDKELNNVTGGVGIAPGRSGEENPTVDKLTLALHGAEIFAGREHALYLQIQKCIDTYYEGRLIRDEVEIAIDILLSMEDKGTRNSIIAGLQDALVAHHEA